MKRRRPKFSKPDENHNIVPMGIAMCSGGLTKQNAYKVRRFFMQGYAGELHDLSQYGGELLDWMLIIGRAVGFIEVKVQREVKDASRQKYGDAQYYYNKLEPGEKSFFDKSPAMKAICSTEEQVIGFAEKLLEIAKEIEKL